MATKKNFYTIMFIPNGNIKPFSIHVHKNIVYSLSVFLIVFFIGFSLLVVKSGQIAAKLQLVYMLSTENKQLKAENTAIHLIKDKIEKIEQMSKYLQKIAQATNIDTKKEVLLLSKSIIENDTFQNDKKEITKKEPKISFTEKQYSANEMNNVIPNISPIIDGWITKRFTAEMSDTSEPHYGIDYAAKNGTIIRATAPGTVIDISNDKYFGLLLTIKHNHDFLTKFGHCSRTLVSIGDHIERGQTIALVGNTGRSSAPHLHYEVVKDGKNVDPAKYLFGNFEK